MLAAAAKPVSIAESTWRKRVHGALGTQCERDEAHKRARTAIGVSVTTHNGHSEEGDDDTNSDRTVSSESSGRTRYNPSNWIPLPSAPTSHLLPKIHLYR